MEDLALLAGLAYLAMVVCVGYSVISFVLWVLSLFGGVCLGC